MLIFSVNNPTPQIGQLIYRENRNENEELEFASLDFIDEEITDGKRWMYTEIAHIENSDDPIGVYLGFESGEMPPKYTRIATNDDINLFIKYIKEGKILGEDSLDSWLKNIESDKFLLTSEKERINKLLQEA